MVSNLVVNIISMLPRNKQGEKTSVILTNKYNKSILAFAFVTNPRLFNSIIHELKYSKYVISNEYQ